MDFNIDRISYNMSNTVHNDNISPFNVTKSGLTLVHLNIQHILPKIDEIKHTLATCKKVINVIGFSETFLGESHLNTEIHINGYNCVRRDRPNGKGGGLLVYVQESLDFIHRPDLQKDQTEAIWIEVVLKHSKKPSGRNGLPTSRLLIRMVQFVRIYGKYCVYVQIAKNCPWRF